MTMVTQKDVASAVGVSRSLVSKVLNNNLGTTQVGTDLIERIQATADQLGYRKNLSALNLKSQRHGVIAVAMCLPGTHTSGIGMRILSALTQFTNQSDIRLDMRFYEGKDGFAATADELNMSRADALVVIGVLPANAQAILEERQQKGMPVVTVFNRPCSPIIPNIDIDFQNAAEQIEALFASQGCERVIVTPKGAPFLKRVSEHMKAPFLLPPEQALPDYLNGYPYAAAETWAKALIDANINFDGILASSDEHAAAIISVLQANGKRVPEDVVVLGINDSGWGEFWPTPIASINAKYDMRVKRALKMAHNILHNDDIDTTPVTVTITNRKSATRIVHD